LTNTLTQTKVKSSLFALLICSSIYAQDIFISSVKNNIQLGALANNRELGFGLKNILEEAIQQKGYDINPKAEKSIDVEILYFDVKTKSMQLAIYGNSEEITEIILQGVLLSNGKEVKKAVAKGQATSISASTLIIDKGGKFSQTNVSTALKKVCEQLIQKLKL
jgi:uncharacterized lipoprotein YajG